MACRSRGYDGHHIPCSAHELEVALANVRVVVEGPICAGDAIGRDMLASLVSLDHAAPPLFVRRGDQ